MSMIIAWLIVIFGIIYWVLNKFVKFMTAGHLKLKDLIRAGLWSIIIILIWRKLHPGEAMPERFKNKDEQFKRLINQAKNGDF